MKTAIYMRVSTEEQAKEGYSLQAQRRKLVAYCDARDWEIIQVYCDEGISGSSIEKRPQATLMLNDLKKGLFENILILKVDRLCRNTRNLLEIVDLCKAYNVRLNAVEESIDYTTPTGKMMLTILGSFAELERSTITSRMVSGKEQKQRDGLYMKTPWLCYGFQWEGDILKPHPIESQVVLKIIDFYLAGNSMLQVAKLANAEGYRTRDGRLWSCSNIGRLLRNPTLKGYTTWHSSKKGATDKVCVKAKNVVPLISEEKFEQIQHLLPTTTKLFKAKHVTCKFWFGKTLYCGYCGRKMVTRVSHGRLYYCCTGKRPDLDPSRQCEFGRSYCQTTVEKMFLDHLTSTYDLSKCEPPKQEKEDTSKIEAAIHANEEKRKRLTNIFLDGLISKDEYLERLDNLKKFESEMREKMVQISTNFTADEWAKMGEQARDLVGVWQNMDDQDKRNMVDTLFKRIDITKNGTKVVFFD